MLYRKIFNGSVRKSNCREFISRERRIAATCFITFVALKDGKPSSVPQVLPETEEEHWLHTTGAERAESRKKGV